MDCVAGASVDVSAVGVSVDTSLGEALASLVASGLVFAGSAASDDLFRRSSARLDLFLMLSKVGGASIGGLL